MEVLAIMFWLVVLGADIAFMTQIPRLCRDFENWLDNRKRPGRAATRTKGGPQRSITVYHNWEDETR